MYEQSSVWPTCSFHVFTAAVTKSCGRRSDSNRLSERRVTNWAINKFWNCEILLGASRRRSSGSGSFCRALTMAPFSSWTKAVQRDLHLDTTSAVSFSFQQYLQSPCQQIWIYRSAVVLASHFFEQLSIEVLQTRSSHRSLQWTDRFAVGSSSRASWASADEYFEACPSPSSVLCDKPQVQWNRCSHPVLLQVAEVLVVQTLCSPDRIEQLPDVVAGCLSPRLGKIQAKLSLMNWDNRHQLCRYQEVQILSCQWTAIAISMDQTVQFQVPMMRRKHRILQLRRSRACGVGMRGRAAVDSVNAGQHWLLLCVSQY